MYETRILKVVLYLMITWLLVEGKRNYVYTGTEIDLTNAVIKDRKKCNNDEIPIFVYSAPQNSGRRQTVRETWAQDAIKFNISVTFVLGYTNNISIQSDLQSENDKHRDIIQFGFVDDDHSIGLKTIALLKWISSNCLVGNYIIKTDDDVMINVEKLKKQIDANTFQSGITGILVQHPNVNRDSNSTRFMPTDVYKEDKYPNIVSGPAIVMSTDVVKNLSIGSVSKDVNPKIDVDDIYVYGIVAENLGIKRHDSKEFHDLYSKECDIDPCLLHDVTFLHGCQLFKPLYERWKHTKQDECIGHAGIILLVTVLVLLIVAIIVGAIVFYRKKIRKLRTELNLNEWE